MFGLDRLFVKDESTQPFGTWKDRRSRIIIDQAKHDSVQRLVMVTSGNAGYSLARFAARKGIKVSLIMDKKLPHKTIDTMRSVADEVLVKDLTRRFFRSGELVSLVKKTKRETVRDVTNGYEEAFAPIIAEIRHLRPDYVICPFGSGEGFIGLYQGIVKSNLPTKLIGVAPRSRVSIADKLTTAWKPYAKQLAMIKKDGHRILFATEIMIRESYDLAKDFFHCEPSSAIVLAGLRLLRPAADDTIVVINTGKTKNNF